MLGLFYFKISFNNPPSINSEDRRERRSESVLGYSFLDSLQDQLFGEHSVRQPSSHSPPYGSIRSWSIRRLSSQPADGTVKLGDLGQQNLQHPVQRKGP